MKLAIITQIRNESKRLEEWIRFHRIFHDVDYFLFYLDNPEDDSREVLDKLKEIYNLDYKFTNPVGDYRGNDCMIATHRQKESFTDGFNILKHDYDWIGIFDVDEWIVPVDLDNFNFKQTLSEFKDNVLYLPMYNYKPPFDYSKSITEQNFYRWTTQERADVKHDVCGKSIIKGKIFLDKFTNVDIHLGPDLSDFKINFDQYSKDYKFRLLQFQNHLHHADKKYELYDDSIKILMNTIIK